MVRWIVRALAILVMVAIALVVLDFAELLVTFRPDDSEAMADTIPACDGRVMAEGLTYRIRDPQEDDVVALHAALTEDGKIVPDKDATERTLVLRVVAGPGDVIEGREGTVFVNDIKLDDVATKPFPKLTVPSEQYFLLGDNRDVAIDSRTFGPVLANTIFGRVFVVAWPLRDITFHLGQGSGTPPGPIDCS
jgi:signal peptidase I